MTDERFRSIRSEFGSAMLPAVSIQAGCPEAAMRELQSAASGASFTRFDLANRGRYDVSFDEPPRDAVAALVEIVAACVGESIEVVIHRWVRLGRGDYELVRDDAKRFERLAPRGLDVVVDLSDAASGEAEVVFTHRGHAFFTMPQRPRELAIVGRRPTVQRYSRYLTHRLGAIAVVRLELGFLPITSESPQDGSASTMELPAPAGEDPDARVHPNGTVPFVAGKAGRQ